MLWGGRWETRGVYGRKGWEMRESTPVHPSFICLSKIIAWIKYIHIFILQIVSIFWYHVHYKICIAYTLITMLPEINTMFLHTRKLMQICQFDTKAAGFQTVKYLNILTFIVTRFGSDYFIFRELYYVDKSLFTAQHFILMIIARFVMLIFNMILFSKLVKSDILPRKVKQTWWLSLW